VAGTSPRVLAGGRFTANTPSHVTERRSRSRSTRPIAWTPSTCRPEPPPPGPPTAMAAPEPPSGGSPPSPPASTPPCTRASRRHWRPQGCSTPGSAPTAGPSTARDTTCSRSPTSAGRRGPRRTPAAAP
jgi:hypothetical protein